jgi:S-adenosylmethionine hydrolase
MGNRNHNAFIKKQKAEKKRKKKIEKQEEKDARKGEEKSGKLEDMIAYVDEFGNISDTPPEDEPPVIKKDKKDKEDKTDKKEEKGEKPKSDK